MADGRQILVYSMNLAMDQDLAMILPLPVPPDGPDDAVEFIDLSGYSRFFKDLSRAFPPMILRAKGGMLARAQSQGPGKLKIHRVGAFEASYVPSMAAFSRLDERFQLPADVWQAVPRYGDFGFAVFKLAPRRGWFRRVLPQTIQPMALSFPRRDTRSLFFPTVHVHDGQVHERARFDHSLYCQPDPLIEETFGWQRSTATLDAFMDRERSGDVIELGRPCYRSMLLGESDNHDVVLTPPALSGLDALTGGNRWFRFRIDASPAYFEGARQPYLAWKLTARHQIDELSDLLRTQLPGLLQQHCEDWGMRPYDERLTEYPCMGGRVVGNHFTEAGPLPGSGGPLRVRFSPSCERVGPQEIRLCFDDVPERARCQHILEQLSALLERLPAR